MMMDNGTRREFKAEHVVDIENELMLAVERSPADRGDTETLVDSVIQAKPNLDVSQGRVGLGGERIEEGCGQGAPCGKDGRTG
jgi:hypothetical protein